mgnify:CR=1 FL=1
MEAVEKQKEYIQKVNEINKDKNLKYHILTMGCQLNENDSEKLVGMVEQMGYIESENLNDADLYLINTCCVRENAEEKVFGKLGELKAIKDQRDIIIAIGGCMMQEEHIQQKIKKSYPFVNVIFGTHTMQNLPENIYKAIIKNEKVKDVIDIDGEIYEGLPIKRSSEYKASVTIMYGCNNFCSYCIVPYVRGRERSREPEKILEEVNESGRDTDNTWYSGTDKWNQKFVWANLYCIAPRSPKHWSEANPKWKMIKPSIDEYILLMKKYMLYYMTYYKNKLY